MKKVTLFTNEWRDFEDTYGMTLEEYNEEHETNYTEEYEVFAINEEWEWDDFSVIHNNKAFNDLLILADLGLWNGRRTGYREGDGLNVTLGGYDYMTYYVERGNLRVKGIHHDGTNCMLVRRWRDHLTEESRERYLDHLYNGTATKSMINYYTEAIGNVALELMGWA